MRNTAIVLVIAAGLLGLVGACLLSIGGLALIGSMGPEPIEGGVQSSLAVMICGVPFLGLAAALVWLVVRDRRTRRNESIEAQVLSVAIQRNYRITATEAAMLTGLSLPEARTYLEGLARRGEVGVEIGENGTLVYVFHGAP